MGVHGTEESGRELRRGAPRGSGDKGGLSPAGFRGFGKETDSGDDDLGAFVYVNDTPRPYFPGITVKFAIGPEQAKRVAEGKLRVVNSRGFEVGLDGSLVPEERIFVVGGQSCADA